MKRRTTVALEQEQYERLEQAARRHGHTISEELRQLVDSALPRDNPNQGLISLIGMFKEPGSKPASWIDSAEFKAEMADAVRPATQQTAK